MCLLSKGVCCEPSLWRLRFVDAESYLVELADVTPSFFQSTTPVLMQILFGCANKYLVWMPQSEVVWCVINLNTKTLIALVRYLCELNEWSDSVLIQNKLWSRIVWLASLVGVYRRETASEFEWCVIHACIWGPSTKVWNSQTFCRDDITEFVWVEDRASILVWIWWCAPNVDSIVRFCHWRCVLVKAWDVFCSIGLTLNEFEPFVALMRNKVQYAFVLDVISRGENLHGSDCHVNIYVSMWPADCHVNMYVPIPMFEWVLYHKLNDVSFVPTVWYENECDCLDEVRLSQLFALWSHNCIAWIMMYWSMHLDYGSWWADLYVCQRKIDRLW